MLPSNRRYYLDSIFDNFINENDQFSIMKCDVYEEKGEYHIEADIPGFKKDEISVECEDGYVIINAIKNSEEKEDSDKNYIKRERFYGKVTRKFYVGDVDSDMVKAKFKDGILEIVVPKQEKLPNKKNIEIK